MSFARGTLEALIPTVAAPEPAPAAPRKERARVYLRRYAVQRARPRHGRVLLALCLLGSLLFSKVWESTIANSLSMERDRLRREVRGLENRIRLSSELRDQAALREGIDSRTLQAQGFIAPDPARIIEIDLDQAMPRAVTRSSVAERVGAFLKRIRIGRPVAPVPDASAVPVRAGVDR
jgi:hypothetical protein